MAGKEKFIVIEGPIGVGKTTLAKKLAKTFNCELMLEGFSKNPFLKKFYQNQEQYAFSTQLHFLLMRSKQYAEYKLEKSNKSATISDYFLGKDLLFAELTLNKEELKMYSEIYNILGFNHPKPDLVIYLQAPIDKLMNRIKTRAIDYEQGITEKYLNTVVDAYTNYFHTYNQSPLLIINTSNVNINEDYDYKMLINEISKDIKGKKYFNPTTPNE
ncbi:MAG: deoxynucleoside kinase [Pseudomonadota bacterium]|nr:deoxynucleoside kinase [Pseudomonadota bacterium]MED5274430.1 deoxynucleoside kinase [Pseudomonadota bacterium]|tara:strand:- start:367 stop:1011 length:645 start_codon:yes stop_codon:yes gene_type:complete